MLEKESMNDKANNNNNNSIFYCYVLERVSGTSPYSFPKIKDYAS